MTSSFPTGKLPLETLARLLARHKPTDPRVVVGPGVGLDFAVIDLDDRYLVAKTDPITFATDRIGWYAVHVNANDVACSGAAPRWFLATSLLPEGMADDALAEAIFEGIQQACEAIGVSLVGGHTEITYGIDRPILVGCMLGEVEKDRLITAAGAHVGDSLVLAKGVPIEATAIIAREKATELADRFEPDFLRRCQDFLFDPGISVVKAAAIATGAGRVHAMHDPTEGGLATCLWELAEASRCALEVDGEAIPILPEGRALCEAYGLDPLAIIASGALLLTAPPEDVDALQAALAQEGIPAAVIGRVVPGDGPKVHLKGPKGPKRLPLPARDEIAKLFD